jgi:hypothetical protein
MFSRRVSARPQTIRVGVVVRCTGSILYRFWRCLAACRRIGVDLSSTGRSNGFDSNGGEHLSADSARSIRHCFDQSEESGSERNEWLAMPSDTDDDEDACLWPAQVFLVQNEKYYWSFPKGKLKLNPQNYTFESQWSCALREVNESGRSIAMCMPCAVHRSFTKK